MKLWFTMGPPSISFFFKKKVLTLKIAKLIWGNFWLTQYRKLWPENMKVIRRRSLITSSWTRSVSMTQTRARAHIFRQLKEDSITSPPKVNLTLGESRAQTNVEKTNFSSYTCSGWQNYRWEKNATFLCKSVCALKWGKNSKGNFSSLISEYLQKFCTKNASITKMRRRCHFFLIILLLLLYWHFPCEIFRYCEMRGGRFLFEALHSFYSPEKLHFS